nr:MAG TPA: hypothetical protein [Crassvirales sp.]
MLEKLLRVSNPTIYIFYGEALKGGGSLCSRSFILYC